MKTYKFDYERYDSLDAMPAEVRELVAAAKRATGTAFAPYSNFRVGAAARLQSGRIIIGSNQESEVFPAGVCAERTLLGHCQVAFQDDPITDFAIASEPGLRECYPCGICRQVLNDTEKRQGLPIRVIMASDSSATVIPTARYLLPFIFEL